MPTPRTPNEVKRRRGNPGKRPLPPASAVHQLPRVLEPPEPSRELEAAGRDAWDRLWRGGASWLAASDEPIMMILCEAIDERVGLRKIVLDEGYWRDRVALRSLEKEIHQLLGVCGFSPAARSRLGIAEVSVGGNDVLAELKARRDARLATRYDEDQ